MNFKRMVHVTQEMSLFCCFKNLPWKYLSCLFSFLLREMKILMNPKNAVLITLLTSHELHWFFSEWFIVGIVRNVANSPDWQKLAEANPWECIHKKIIFQWKSGEEHNGSSSILQRTWWKWDMCCVVICEVSWDYWWSWEATAAKSSAELHVTAQLCITQFEIRFDVSGQILDK